MRSSRILLMAVGCYVGLAAFACGIGTGRDVLDDALRARESLNSGHIELVSTLHIQKGRLAGSTRTTRAHVYFEGERIRSDLERPPFAAAYRKVVCCFTDGKFFAYYEPKRQILQLQADPPDPRSAEIRRDDDALAKVYGRRDPRKIGMMPVDMQLYDAFDLDEWLNSSRWILDGEPLTEELRGAKCVRWRFLKQTPLPNEGTKEQNILDVWTSPDMENAIVGMRRTALRYETEIFCTLQRVDGFGWFPSRVEYARKDNSVASAVEILDVKVHQFNKPLPEATFEFKGMGVPVGLPIVDFTAELPEDQNLVMSEAGPVKRP
jgi:hypothetical protein